MHLLRVGFVILIIAAVQNYYYIPANEFFLPEVFKLLAVLHGIAFSFSYVSKAKLTNVADCMRVAFNIIILLSFLRSPYLTFFRFDLLFMHGKKNL